MTNSNDQNFKNLILDYPHQALELFAEAEAEGIGSAIRSMPVQQEQLKERLGGWFRELDLPLLVEWPDGRREAILFVLDEEADPRCFNIHRLAHYCLDLSRTVRDRSGGTGGDFSQDRSLSARIAIGSRTNTCVSAICPECWRNCQWSVSAEVTGRQMKPVSHASCFWNAQG